MARTTESSLRCGIARGAVVACVEELRRHEIVATGEIVNALLGEIATQMGMDNPHGAQIQIDQESGADGEVTRIEIVLETRKVRRVPQSVPLSGFQAVQTVRHLRFRDSTLGTVRTKRESGRLALQATTYGARDHAQRETEDVGGDNQQVSTLGYDGTKRHRRIGMKEPKDKS